MSSGAQVDLDWAGIPPSPENGFGGQVRQGDAGAAGTGTGSRAGDVAHLTEEEILEMDSVGGENTSALGVIPIEARNHPSIDGQGNTTTQRDSSRNSNSRSDGLTANAEAEMPAWMLAAAGDPQHAGEAQRLWQEHQAFRAAFSSAEEARAMKEMLPGGAQEVLALRQIVQEVDSLRAVAQEAETLRESAAALRESAASVDRIDAAIFSGDARAQAEVVAEMARANPAAFRSMFAEAAKVLAGMGSRGREEGSKETRGREAGGKRQGNEDRWSFRGQGEQDAGATTSTAVPGTNHPSQELRASESQITNHDLPAANHQSPVTSHQSPHFDPAAYASFERSTNEVVARDVRGSISDTLARVLPEGVAEGAARRIGEDIFNEVHRALAADRALSEQVGDALRERRFGSVEQARVSALLAGRAKQIVPSVARRVIGEWTSSVLGTARNKAARQAAAAARVDIAAAGGSLDSMPLRAMSPREVNYARMSDDEILGM